MHLYVLMIFNVDEELHFCLIQPKNLKIEHQPQKSTRKFVRMKKKTLILHSLSKEGYAAYKGEMAEWSIASVLKTDVPRGTGGSNPSLSAISLDYQ